MPLSRETIAFDEGFKNGYTAASEKKWISNKERAPENYDDVLFLATLKGKAGDSDKKEIFIGHQVFGIIYRCSFYESTELNELVEVTHWMPLPEMPNE